MIVKTKKIYEAEDGQAFASKKECFEYEEKLKKEKEKTLYWSLIYKPDLTEGRGYSGFLYIKSIYLGEDNDNNIHKKLITDFVYFNLKNQIDFVQGVVPIEAWILSPIEKQEFIDNSTNPTNYVSCGDYKKFVRCVTIEYCFDRKEFTSKFGVQVF